ncbi:MAG: [FeFe] hydrogenase H-cluster radical SAM maturase HydG [Candidatus Cloacimonetes bacterium 4572_65]|nr:MAG: [FeFe] hydrogenase H-cluster radical SAM maturase HydG [Candidatus Cloacimonetes bacterium 4572_65]
MVQINTKGLESFIPDGEIFELLEKTKNPTTARVQEIIEKSLNKNRLSPKETATLINCNDPELIQQIFAGARALKEKIYGNRIVLFAPLYVGNECINDCTYCGFRISNKETHRNTLTMDQLGEEVRALESRGHKRLIMVYGEHNMYTPEFIKETVLKTYATKEGKGEIRRVNINAAPLDVEGFKIVKSSGIGTYQIFQESYHQESYEKYHPRGPKSNFLWRLYGLDRAMEAGIDDLGIGALMGLYDWRFEVMGLLYHTIHLENKYNIGPHTISFPRIEPANNTEITNQPPYAVSDDDFKKLVAILRLAVPYTGLILTARESIEIRNEVIEFGVSQIDAGSSIGIGDYSHKDSESFKKSQFLLGDQRSLDDVIGELATHGFLPSFCTACYRLGRTGEHFMEFAIPGFVKKFCTPNALLTVSEYVHDYASEKTIGAIKIQIEKEVELIEDEKVKVELKEKLIKVANGERDLYF